MQSAVLRLKSYMNHDDFDIIEPTLEVAMNTKSGVKLHISDGAQFQLTKQTSTIQSTSLVYSILSPEKAYIYVQSLQSSVCAYNAIHYLYIAFISFSNIWTYPAAIAVIRPVCPIHLLRQ